VGSRQPVSFGATLFNVGDDKFVHPEAFRRVARTAENAGFDSLWFQDHVVIPTNIPDEYPFRPAGEAPLHSDHHAYDVFEAMSFVAGQTDDITLGTNVCVPGYRHTVVLAKNVVTIDMLADERFILGVGAGWMESEFEVLDTPFAERGGRTDEFLSLLQRVYEEETLSFEGEYHQFQETGFQPVSPRGSSPPIFVGGSSGATFRRIAEHGDGWTINWARPVEIRDGRERLRQAWSDYSRRGDPFVMVSRPVYVGTDGPASPDRPLTGSIETIIDDVQAYIDAGVTHLTVMSYETDVDDQVTLLETLGDSVISSY